MKTGKILIVADDSAPSVKAIQFGFNLARDLSAEVILLSVIDPIDFLGNPDAGIFPDDALMAAKAEVETFLVEMKEKHGAGIETEVLTPVGDILSSVTKIAVQRGTYLIVSGTHGRTGLSLLFKGSISQSIIHHSKIPVIVVPAAY
ncbi:universal stress protein [Mucilaginibacter gotjawali]|uniref:Nucleotide-binding universal stress UspA family protein n=2 Tax=Mucilaginibacter gotjawali TaxID=1550579 RepID=A0A839SG64_9SPHI|nr:universal stress protein [Mucilaginibacter gotjawali]MBB3055850.1 nucleotide-binding universal stress UspA family protein [Mucilaginibacter gotjawali]BAU54672.1 Universal stress protein family protein [Mucilaginibacter gotjawali]